MLILSLINILADRQKKKGKKRVRSSARRGLGKLHIRQGCLWLKIRTFISRELQLLQKIITSKAVLGISKNYNRQTPSQGKNHKKGKKKKKEKEKREKRGGEVYHKKWALKH